MAAYVVAREEVFHLDGSLGSIQKVNDKEKLSLGKKQVPEYIRFVFNHTGDGRLKVVENVNEIQWDELSLGQPGAAERVEDVRRSIHAIQVSKAAGKSFLVVFNGMFRDLLVECEMELARTGELTPVSKTPVCQDLPVSEG